MARSRRAKPAAEINFADFDEARAWFGRQKREVCVALAARAALRVLPLIWRARQVEAFPTRIALPVFRAGFVAWTIAEYPTHLDRLRPQAYAAYAAARRLRRPRRLAAGRGRHRAGGPARRDRSCPAVVRRSAARNPRGVG
ncbi:MAG TPA: hypothetical protein VMI30_10930 [Stellaceae bacterium]|nr:hypothetical protein [Stellaceae bacterium]